MAKEEHYEQLKNEVNLVWKTKMEVVEVVIGATGIVTKNTPIKYHITSSLMKPCSDRQQHKYASL